MLLVFARGVFRLVTAKRTLTDFIIANKLSLVIICKTDNFSQDIAKLQTRFS